VSDAALLLHPFTLRLSVNLEQGFFVSANHEQGSPLCPSSVHSCWVIMERPVPCSSSVIVSQLTTCHNAVG